MISIDTNVLFPSVDADNPKHTEAVAFIDSLQQRTDIAVSEFILLELYNLIRNPAVLIKPLGALDAYNVCQSFRHHPRWQLIGFPPDSRSFHDSFWPPLRERSFARRRAYDRRSALSMLRHGVTEFATVNVKDFQGFGFARVWNPLVNP